MIQIHTDGSCLGNPGAGGWAAIIVDEKNRREEIFGGEEHTTNNRMELTAAIRALKKIPAGASVELFTDSSYLKNAFTNGWLAKWKSNGWRTSTKSAVLNQDLWLELDELIATRAVNFSWVKGHAGNFFNERCDELARTSATRIQRGEKFPPPKVEPPKIFNKPNSKLPMIDSPKISEPPMIIPAPAKKISKASKKFSNPLQLSLFDF